VNFDHQHLESASTFDGFEDTPFDRTRDNWGFFAQASALPVHRLQLTLGGRLDENQRFGSFWTYRASALAFASPTTRLRGSVGTGFKEPGLFETFSTSFTRGNPDLQPERTFSVEAGLDQDLASGLLTLGVTAFAQRFRDLIQFNGATASPDDPNFFNVAAANASGMETTLSARPIDAIEGSISYAYVHTKVTDSGFDSDPAATFVEGDRLLRRPTHAVTIKADYVGMSRVRLGAALKWVGNRDDVEFNQFPTPSQRIELPSYVTVDLRSTVTVLSTRRGGMPGIDVTARVENLFDEDYEQAARFLSPGRAIFVGLTTHVR
jgi:vitamin B12 transporter